SGTYYNASQGLFTTVEIVPATSLPTVTVTATDATASSAGPDAGSFTFSRTGDPGAELTVNYALGGSAVRWYDYRRPEGDMPDSVTIPAGSASTTMTINAVANTTGADPETVVLTLSPDAAYLVGSPNSATMTILAGSTPTNPPPPTGTNISVVDDTTLQLPRLGDNTLH